MDIVYLQADLRYNDHLLRTINRKTVLNHTLDRIKQINCGKVVAGIYSCKENEGLMNALKSWEKVEVFFSEDEDVNSRFLNLMTASDAEYVIRVCADQIFLDVEKAVAILAEMRVQGKDFFYHPGLTSVLPDIVSVDCLTKRREQILQKNRYFEALEEDGTVNRYDIKYPCTLLYDFRVNSNVSYRVCKNAIEKNLDIYDLSLLLSKNLRKKDNYLNSTGLLGSWIYGNTWADFFWDENDEVNPWWGETVIDLISKKIDESMRVFEWGTGNSTLFWSRHVEEVVGIEFDLNWYEKMKEIVPKNVRLQYSKLVYDGEYCRKILEEDGQFDIILIDGRDRVRCAYNAVERLKDNGIIIWDNSERENYREGYAFLKNKGFKQLELRSVIYGLPGREDYTSIFYREKNILGL